MLNINLHDSRFYSISFFYYEEKIVADIDIWESNFTDGNFFDVWPAEIIFLEYKDIRVNLISDDGFFMIYDFICSAREDGYFDFSLFMDKDGISRIDVRSKNVSLVKFGSGIRQPGIQYINEDKRREYLSNSKGVACEYQVIAKHLTNRRCLI